MKIVHVDDSKFQARMCGRIIQEALDNIEIDFINDQEMLDKMNDNYSFSEVDVFLTDLLMPKISGHDVLKYVKKVNPNCFLVVISSNVQSTEKALCYEHGADYFIEKPLTSDKVKDFEAFYYDKRK
jgi:CheY-like chemotaxis protein